ncbi:MAG: multidrug effflux MFS transporter [Rhodocyclaceae bacterium]
MLLILSALMSFASISTDVYLPAMPSMEAQLHGAPGSMDYTISGFLIGFSLGQLLWGPVSDRCGRRPPVAIGMLLFVVGSIGCAGSTSVGQMVGWRVLQALGASVGPVLARAMVRDLYDRQQAAHTLSTLIMIMGIAPLAGPILGGQVLRLGSWPLIFWGLAGVGVLTLAALRALPETLPRPKRATTALSYALADYRALLQDRRLLGYALSGGFFYAGAYAFIAGTPFAYIDYYGVSPQAYGLLFGANILGIIAANYLNGRLLRRHGSERLFRWGTWGALASALVLAIDAYTGFGGLAGLAVPVFVYMSMNGFIVANSVAGALEHFPRRAGAASALLGALHYGSGIVSAALVAAFADGTPWTMGWVIGASGLGCLVSVLALSQRPQQAAS